MAVDARPAEAQLMERPELMLNILSAYIVLGPLAGLLAMSLALVLWFGRPASRT